MKKLFLVIIAFVFFSCSNDDNSINQQTPETCICNRVIEEKIVYQELIPGSTTTYNITSIIEWQRVANTDLLFYSNNCDDDGKIIGSTDYIVNTSPTTRYHKYIRYIIRK